MIGPLRHAVPAGALAVLAASVLWSATADAHAFRPTLLRADVHTDGRHTLTWKTDAADPRALAGSELVFPEPCQVQMSERASDTEQIVHFELACGDAPLVVAFSRPPIEVVLDLRADGTPRRIERIGAVPEALDLSALARPADDAPPSAVSVRSWLRLGVEHIVFGWDHLCFVIALAFLVAAPRRVAAVVTGFTLGHTVTLVGATLSWFARPHSGPVEAVIALSILYLAVELTRDSDARERFGHGLGFVVSALFGLVHGFGFAGALSAFQLPEGAEVRALLAFNVGVELGQLAVVAAALVALRAVVALSRSESRPRIESGFRLATAYVVGTVSVYWLLERSIGIVSG